MLSNIQIEKFENDLDMPLVGIFSKDQLPQERKVGDYYINMEDHDKGDGTHWVFAKIFPNRKAIYCDSFGVYAPEQVREFLKPFSPFAYNTRQIQDIKADTCGHYCEALSYFMNYDADPKKSVDENFYDYLNMFSDNTKANNKILKEYLTQNSSSCGCKEVSGGSIASQTEEDYIILVITYNRVERCYKKTLSVLKENNIPSSLINLVVHNEEQSTLYRQGIPKEYYNKIIVTNENKGATGQMNWIYRHYKKGQKLLKLDDDISAIYKVQGDKLVKTNTLKSIIDEGFKLCDENGFKLWGLYPVPNAYFMKSKKEYSTDLRFIVGALMGIINEKIQLDSDIKIKNDYEYSIKSYLNNGGLIRFNRLSFKYDISKNEGERIKTMNRDADILTRRYPSLVKRNSRRDTHTPMGEILLRRGEGVDSDSESEVDGGKLINQELDRDNPDNTQVFVDKIVLTPKIKNLQQLLVKLIEEANIPPVSTGFYHSGSKKRGEIVGTKGYTFNLGGGRRRFLPVGEFSQNKKNPELFKTIVSYANEILPSGFEYSVITLNKNLKAKKHKDGGNDGLGCITFLGDYTGGGLYIYDDKDKPTLYDSHNVVIAFNGAKLAHKTQDFKGNRYAMIFYQQKNKFKIPGVRMVGKGEVDDDSDLKVY